MHFGLMQAVVIDIEQSSFQSVAAAKVIVLLVSKYL
jgi:hypothetical protein